MAAIRPASARGVAAVLTATVVLTACGGQARHPASPPQPTTAPGTATTAGPKPHEAPGWQTIATFRGSSDAVRSVIVSHNALQWQTRWVCQVGILAVVVTPPPAVGESTLDESCPSVGKAVWYGTGPRRLGVHATGHWSVVVEELAAPGATAAG